MQDFKVGDTIKLVSLQTTTILYGLCDDMLKVGDTHLLTKRDTIKSSNIWIANVLYAMDDFELVEVKEVNYILLPNSITLSYDSKVVTITQDDRRYSDIIKAINEDKLDTIPDLVDVTKSFNKGNYELIDGVIHIDGVEISQELTDKVLYFRDNNLPTENLLNFAKKIEANPSFNSRKMLYKFLEHNGHPITKNGNFIAYKKVSAEFKDLHTGKFDNSIGAVVEMDRRLVDENPNNTCSSGLHVATYDYALGFGRGNLVEIEVDPVDVVAVPTDYDGTKMRVCKYVVKSLCQAMLDDGIYEDEEIGDYDELDDLDVW